MTEAEARKILINKSLTGAFSNEECDALSVLFREIEQLQGARNKAIDEFAEKLVERIHAVPNKCIGGANVMEIAEQMKE